MAAAIRVRAVVLERKRPSAGALAVARRPSRATVPSSVDDPSEVAVPIGTSYRCCTSVRFACAPSHPRLALYLREGLSYQGVFPLAGSTSIRLLLKRTHFRKATTPTGLKRRARKRSTSTVGWPPWQRNNCTPLPDWIFPYSQQNHNISQQIFPRVYLPASSTFQTPRSSFPCLTARSQGLDTRDLARRKPIAPRSSFHLAKGTLTNRA